MAQREGSRTVMDAADSTAGRQAVATSPERAAEGSGERGQAARPAAGAAIEVSGLRMRYGTKDVLDGVDLRVERGQLVCLLGPNGAGKTSTLEILEGFRRRSAGEVRVLGADPESGGEDWRARIGVVLQSWRDHGRWKVRELLRHIGRYYVPYGDEITPRPFDVDELLSLVGLTEHADLRVGALSGGQRRRLDVAVGLVGRPELLFLDEPTVGFDPEARQEFHDLILRLVERSDLTIVLTTHDLAEAEKLAERILVLAGGTVVADGTPADLARQVSNTVTVRYTHDGTDYEHYVEDATAFVRDLLTRYADVSELEVRRPRLEEVYLSMVRAFENNDEDAASSEIPWLEGDA